MSDDTAPNPETPAEDSFSANYAHQERLLAENWSINKTVVMAALAAAGITHIFITFDGSGDSGQIENVEAKAGEGPVDFPAASVTWLSAQWGVREPKPEQTELKTAVEELAYQCLERTHGGWEINEGAYGDITVDVAEQTVTLDYNQRIETSEYFQHVL